MINTITFATVPAFGGSATTVQPPSPDPYVNGYLGTEVLPAEHFNWFLKNMIGNGNLEWTGINHLITELDNLVTGSGASVTPGDDTQVVTAVKKLADTQTEVFTPVSGYTPAPGDVVEMYFDGTIRKAKRVNSAILASGSAVVGARVAKLDATHAVILYAVGLVISAVVATVNPADLSISYGTPVTVFTCTTTLSTFDIAPLSSSLVLVGYSLTGNSFTTQSVRTLSISGTTITVNTAVNGGNAQVTTMYPIDSTRVAMAWWSATTTLNVAVVSVSGTTPTINSSATATITNSFGVVPLHLGLTVNSDLSFILLSHFTNNTNGGDQFLTGFSLSGTTITAGSPVDMGFATLAHAIGWPVEEGPLNSFISYVISSAAASANPPHSGGFVSPIRISTTNVTNKGYGAPKNTVFSDQSNFMDHVLKAVDKANGVFAFAGVLQNGPDGNQWHRMFIFARRGGGVSDLNEFSFGDEFVFKPGSTTASGTCQGSDTLSSGITLFAIGTGIASQSVVVAMRRRNTAIGIAVDNAGTVQVGGTFVTSGLTAGAKYYSDDNGNPSVVPSELVLGYAKSTTQLSMGVVPGV
jgi:hypothetical protein